MMRARKHDVRVRLVAAQVEEPVTESLLLGNLLGARDLKRQGLGGTEHLEPIDGQLHEAGRKAGIHILRVARRSRRPTTLMTVSSFSAEAASKTGDDGVNTHCVTP